MENENEGRWRQLAEENWLRASSQPRKVRPEVIKKEIWDILEKGQFEFKLLLVLENLQLLERYLWPGYDEDVSNYQVLLITLMVTAKRREGLPIWEIFQSRPDAFSSLFRRVLALSVDQSLAAILRSRILDFLIAAFQSLDNGLVRKECAPLVSVSLWNHLKDDQARESRFEEHAPLRKAWRAAGRRYDAADEALKLRLDFERSWLYSMTLTFVDYLHSPNYRDQTTLNFCERFLEFLTDLESQLPTRRYVNTLLKDLNLLALIRISPLFKHGANGHFRDLYYLFLHFVYFTINDHTGAQYTGEEANHLHCAKLAKLQRAAIKDFKSKLTILALSNYAAIEQRSELQTHLLQLTDLELSSLADSLGFRTTYHSQAQFTANRELLLEVLIGNHERHRTYQEVIDDLSVLPTDDDLYEPTLLQNENYNGERSLAIPKLNLQYLSVGDFLWRSIVLYRCESFYEVRTDMEDTVRRLQPRLASGVNEVSFGGFSRMALPISKPGILEVAPPKVGSVTPMHVRAEIALNLSKLADNVRREWDSLKPGDVVYLLSVGSPSSQPVLSNGHPLDENLPERLFQTLRTAEVVQLLDEKGSLVRDSSSGLANGHGHKSRIRRLIVNLDASAYRNDELSKGKGKPDIYESINILVRRKGRENNFKRVLESIKGLALTDTPIPYWLREVFLGYGDPSSATYTRLANKLASLDFRDTFLNWQHLVESLPGKRIEPDESQNGSFGPPYILETSVEPASDARISKKRRRDEQNAAATSDQTVKICTYKPTNSGPYPEDAPKKNQVRFTPAQVEAIISGTQPGLTVIVGPPGTGKTDVATQIISNIYHDFPEQRTLLVAHSNQALNQLFQKITRLDIDHRHLLRLGHGEEELETEESYGKHGRVESYIDNRARYLAEVDRLAANLGAPGAHGNSCETAGYFNSVYVTPAWAGFWSKVEASAFDGQMIRNSFPFYPYFSNAPQPLFPSDAGDEELVEIAKGCQKHIKKIFTELEDIRPFEILRHSRDRANYLLIKEARIVAMTSTHAAMRRQEIADTGFHYHNVIMEEAAQITEIENFIPFALQNAKRGETPLQRIVLCGDHLQNSPIVQNLAFRKFANLDQSLFLRFVRLGVPIINLDQQGRARPSIAELYKWRYEKLGDLPLVREGLEYRQANAGLRYEYQFINVPDYKGVGEQQPSPHFIQNLGEAEYAVAIYQYMRLLGYPASKISILTTYAGQRALIRDVLGHRCSTNRLFGLPRIVTTVDKYQGEQNDYIILSLVRTNRVGYLRDIRRLTVALSRARLGIYILGRKELFESCYELKGAFDLLLKRPTSLMVVPGEMTPTKRAVETQVEATEMTGVEHLGQYVYEMTQAKIAQITAGGGATLPPPTILPDSITAGSKEDSDELKVKDEDEDVDGGEDGDEDEDEDEVEDEEVGRPEELDVLD